MKVKFILFTISLIIILPIITAAQTSGSISGYVYNENDSTTIPGAQIYIKTGQKIYGAISDQRGFFRIKPVEPGTYTVVFTFSGLDTVRLSGTVVNADLNTDLHKIYLPPRTLGIINIVYHKNLIDEDGATIITLESKTLQVLPTKGDIKMILKYMSSDFYVDDRTRQVYFRGSRAGTSAYYLDGMRVDDIKLPGMGVGSMQIYSGGVPAKYGDFTGGVIVVETKSYNDWLQEKEALKRYLKETEAPNVITVPRKNKKAEKQNKEEKNENKNG